MPSNVSRTGVLILVAISALAPSAAGECRSEDQRVIIDHRNGRVDPDGTLRLREDENFCVEIVNTIPGCVTVNLEEVPSAAFQALGAGPPSAVAFRVRHHEDAGSYKVAIGIKPESACSGLSPLTREIPVLTYGWTLGLAGAFTADGLTDPVHFLESGQRPKPSDPETVESGFFVRERSSAEDDAKLGAATFVHLYHSDPARFAIGRLHWAPLSFGLGIADGSQAKYFLGTGVRFSTRAFLTAGGAIGGRQRLPVSLGTGDFTTDQNALKNLGVETSLEWFVSLSFRGLDIDATRLSAPFKKQKSPSPAS